MKDLFQFIYRHLPKKILKRPADNTFYGRNFEGIEKDVIVQL